MDLVRSLRRGPVSRRLSALLALALLAAPLGGWLAGCSDGGHHHAPPFDPTIREIEPNGTAANANFISSIRPEIGRAHV